MRLPLSVLRIRVQQAVLLWVLRWAVILLVSRTPRVLFACVSSPLSPLAVRQTAKSFLKLAGSISRQLIFLVSLRQPATMAKALEIRFSTVRVARAIAPDVSLQFLAAMHARSGAFPASNVVQTARAFRLQDANRSRAGQRLLQSSPGRDMPFPALALFSALPVPFASSARHSFEISVDLPGASRSIDRADCSDWERGVAEAACGHWSLAVPAAGLLAIQSLGSKSRLSRLRLPCLRIVVPQAALVCDQQFVEIGDDIVILGVDLHNHIRRA